MLGLYALFEDAFFVFKAIYLFLVLAGNRVKRLKNGGCIKVDVLHIYAVLGPFLETFSKSPTYDLKVPK